MSSPANKAWIDALVAKHSAAGVLIDSNLLFVQVVGMCGYLGSSRVKGCSEYSPDDAVAIADLVAKFRVRGTTPHVLAETSNLINGCHRSLHSELFETLKNQVLEVLVESAIPALQAVQSSCYRRLGITDAALAEAGRAGRLVFTNDLPLSIELQSTGISVLHFDTMLRSIE